MEQAYAVTIRIEAFDRPGLLRDISGAIADMDINMSSVNVSTHADNTAMALASIGVKSVSQLSELLRKIEGVRDVLDVRRVVPL